MRTSWVPDGACATIDEDAIHLRPGAQAGGNPLGDCLCVIELRAGWKLDRQDGTAGILRGQKTRSERGCCSHRQNEYQQSDSDGDPPMAHRPREQARVMSHDGSVSLLRMLSRGEEIGSEHRRNQARAKQRKQNLHGNSQAKLFEELSGYRSHEACGQENRDDGQAYRNDRNAYLVGRFHGRVVRRFTHSDMPHDVLDFDDGIVHEDPRAQHDCETRSAC